MKYIKLLAFAMAMSCTCSVFAQSKSDLKEEIEQLKQQNQMLMQMMQNMQNQQNNNQGYNQQYSNQGYNNQGYNQQYQQGGYNQNGYGNQQNSYVEGMGNAVQKTRVQSASEMKTGTDLRAYGMDKSAKSQFAKNKAENQARAALARQIEEYSRYGISQYNEETTAAGNTGLDANDQELIITAAKKVVSGASIIDSQEYYDKNTRMYTWEVCVSYDEANLFSVMEEQSARIKKNKAKFERDMQRYFDELDRLQGRETETEWRENSKNKLEQSKLDAQQKRDMEMKQQDADNALRIQESQQNYNLDKMKSNQEYNLNSQKQAQDTATKMQQQKIDGDIQKGYSKEQEIKY